MNTMTSIVIHGQQDLRLEETEVPQPGEGEVRLRVAYIGVCGSDLSYFHRGAVGSFVLRQPLVPGHELSATVDADPSGRWAPGTPVTVHPATFGRSQPAIADRPHLWPGGAYLGSASTWPHTQGAAAQYFLVRDDMIRPLPPGLDLRRATLAEPLGVALHGIQVAGGVGGARVLVSGAGPIGLLAAAAAKAERASEVVVTDVHPQPLQRAVGLGVDDTINVATETVPGESFDVVLECSGAPGGVSASLDAARRAGIVVQIGMLPSEPSPINIAPLVAKEVQLRGAFRFNQEIEAAIDMLAAHPHFARVITHEFHAAEAREAFHVASDPTVSGKVLVAMWDGPGS